MAKRGKPGRNPRQSTFDKILAGIPARAEFKFAMVADSSDEVSVDIDTNLQDGEAWVVYGGMFDVENTDPTVPQLGFAGTVDNAYTLQVHRNDDSDILLNFNDDDLMYHWCLHKDIYVSTNGGNVTPLFGPFRFGWRTITFSEKLRVMFRSAADDVDLSATTVQIAGYLMYDRISAPSIGQSKLGQIADL